MGEFLGADADMTLVARVTPSDKYDLIIFKDAESGLSHQVESIRRVQGATDLVGTMWTLDGDGPLTPEPQEIVIEPETTYVGTEPSLFIADRQDSGQVAKGERLLIGKIALGTLRIRHKGAIFKLTKGQSGIRRTALGNG